MSRWPTGRVIALREIWEGRVWSAWPGIVVDDGPDLLVVHVPAGVTVRHAAGPDGRVLRLYADSWTFTDRTTTRPVLSLSQPGTRHAPLAFWDDAWRFMGWYVNLERPLGRSGDAYDFVDHCLDVLIPADGSTFTWKDEDELEEAVRRGIFSAADAAAFRAEGERAALRILAGAPPFDRDWPSWRPDRGWPLPTLPEGWDVVEETPERMDGLALLDEHVARFNAAIRTGEWGPMLELFDEKGVLRFEGVPVGPFAGREAIAEAYRTQPPDDEVRILDAREGEGGSVVARYAWLAQPDVTAGEMRLRHRGGRIAELVVTFDPGARP